MAVGNGMPTTRTFRVSLEGGNCLLEVDGQMRRLAFFATRFVEAADAVVAGRVARRLVEGELRKMTKNLASAPPSLSVLAVEEESHGVPGRGFTWYPEYGE